jgi:hypothetical protein
MSVLQVCAFLLSDHTVIYKLKIPVGIQTCCEQVLRDTLERFDDLLLTDFGFSPIRYQITGGYIEISKEGKEKHYVDSFVGEKDFCDYDRATFVRSSLDAMGTADFSKFIGLDSVIVTALIPVTDTNHIIIEKRNLHCNNPKNFYLP